MLMWISEVIILTDMMFISVNICEYIWQISVNIMDQCLFKYLGQILTGVFTGVNICFWNSQIFTWAYLWISSKKYEQILTCRTADVVANTFVSWYKLFRRTNPPKTPQDVQTLTTKADRLLSMYITVFPYKNKKRLLIMDTEWEGSLPKALRGWDRQLCKSHQHKLWRTRGRAQVMGEGTGRQHQSGAFNVLVHDAAMCP